MSVRKLYFFSNQSQEIAVLLMIGLEKGASSSLIQSFYNMSAVKLLSTLSWKLSLSLMSKLIHPMG